MRIPYRTSISRLSRGKQCVMGCLAVAALSAPVAADVSTPAALTEFVERYNEHEDIDLPQPSQRQLDQIVQGSVVKYRLRYSIEQENGKQRQRIRIVGYRLVEQPRMLVWLAALDVGTRHSSRLTEHRVAGDEIGGSAWYQFLHLPWPVKDRHWVIRSHKNTSLAAATQGAVWEHAWSLEDNGPDLALQLLKDRAVSGLKPRDGRGAIYMPVNKGGWTMISVNAKQTFVVAHVTSNLGGWIPDGLVASFVSNQLESMLNGLEPRSLTIDEQYDVSYPVFTGDGQLITREMASAAAAMAQSGH